MACGLDYVRGYVAGLRFDQTDLAYLASLRGADGEALFEEGLLAHLDELRITCDIDAVAEGTVVFPHEQRADGLLGNKGFVNQSPVENDLYHTPHHGSIGPRSRHEILIRL